MTEFERMEKGLLYDCNDQDILKVQLPFVEKHWDFNQLRPTDFDGKQAFKRSSPSAGRTVISNCRSARTGAAPTSISGTTCSSTST